MSYILNALRKSEQERQATGRPPLPVRLAAAGGLKPARARRRWPWLAAGAGAAAVAAAGAVLVLGRGEAPDGGREVVAVAEAVGEPATMPALLVATVDPVRPSADSPTTLAAARLAPAPAPPPAEPQASPAIPDQQVPQGVGPLSVPSLPLAELVPPPPNVAAGTPPPPVVAQAPAVVAALPAPAGQEPLPRPTTDREAIAKSAQLNELGWDRERDDRYDSAIDAFTRALALRPDYAEAYFGRAWANERLDRLDQAIADYGQAVRLKPDFATAYNSRGIALLYRGRHAEAGNDFATAFDLGDGELKRYAMLWRYIAFERDGQDAPAQLAADARAVDLDRWPGVLARYYLGESSTDAVLAEAESKDPITRRERLCVAYFFLGQRALLRGDPSHAKDYFRSTLDTGVTAFAQYAAAERELLRLTSVRE
ncbi:MAG TPA: tetratricopeptide repeat protein [Alphaproteobacteria bacterium]